MFVVLAHSYFILHNAFENRSIPRPPPRRMRLFSDHNHPQFREKRRLGLERFLQNLLHLPRIGSDQYVLFLVLPIIRHYQMIR